MRFLLIVFAAAACGFSINAAPQNQQNSSVEQPNSDNDKIISDGVLSFGISLFKDLYEKSKPEGNLLIAPYNVYATLGLVHLGAAGNTRNEIAGTLGLPKDDQRVTAIHESLSQISKKMQYKPENEFQRVIEIVLANGIFVQNGFPISENYLQFFKNHYDGNVTNVDFADHSAESTDAMNSWVSEKTKGRIPKIFSSPLDPSTVAVLISSLYFSARWKDSFYNSTQEKFNTGVQEIDAQLMRNMQFIPYISKPTLQLEAVSIPYRGGDCSMVIVLPQPSQTIEKLINNLDAKTLSEILKNRATEKVDYKIPKFKFSWQNSLKESLKKQGLKSIFEEPNLSNLISIKKNVKVSEVSHATEIDVDKEGTKASAVTAVQFVSKSAIFYPPREPIPFYANRPFLFYIYYHPKDIILFSGVVHKPTTDDVETPSTQ